MNIDLSGLFSALAPHASVSSPNAPAAADRGREDGHDDRVHEVRKGRHRHHAVRRGDVDGGAETAPSRPQEFATAVEYHRAESTKLRVRTQEGDVVTLRFSARDSLEASSSVAGDDETLVAEIAVRATSTTRLRIAVQGELNADELAALATPAESAEASDPSVAAANAIAPSNFSVSFKLRVFHSILIATTEAVDVGEPALPPIVDDALETLAAEREPALDAAA